MQALRLIQRVDPSGTLHVQIPPEFGDMVELIILPSGSETAMNYAFLQQKGGFVREVLGDSGEDVWNEI